MDLVTGDFQKREMYMKIKSDRIIFTELHNPLSYRIYGIC